MWKRIALAALIGFAFVRGYSTTQAQEVTDPESATWYYYHVIPDHEWVQVPDGTLFPYEKGDVGVYATNGCLIIVRQERLQSLIMTIETPKRIAPLHGPGNSVWITSENGLVQFRQPQTLQPLDSQPLHTQLAFSPCAVRTRSRRGLPLNVPNLLYGFKGVPYTPSIVDMLLQWQPFQVKLP